MKFNITKSTKYNKDYGIMLHRSFRSTVLRFSFGIYNWRLEWVK